MIFQVINNSSKKCVQDHVDIQDVKNKTKICMAMTDLETITK